MKVSRLVLTACVLCTAACTEPTEPTDRVRATISVDPHGAILAPDVVQVDQTVSVTVYAFGSGSINCNTPDGTNVTTTGNTVRIEGFVRRPRGNYVCTSDLRRYPLAAAVRFTQVGPGMLRFIGVRTDRDGAYRLDSLERTVTVVP